MYDNAAAIEYLESTFPHLAEEMHDETWDGLLHLQIAVFARWAQDVISSGDRNTWEQVTKAFLILWRDCHPDVTNALNVSFLEHLTFADGKKRRRSWAYDSMPPQMRKAWDAMEDYNRKLHGG
jgi:hypothetical protein